MFISVWRVWGVILTHFPMHVHWYGRVMLLYRVPAKERHRYEDDGI